MNPTRHEIFSKQPRSPIDVLEPRRLFANAVVIDLLAVFTPGAVTEIGSEAKLRTRLQDSVDAMNRAMSNSHIAVSVRLVHAEEVNYAGQNDLFQDRMALTNGAGSLSGVAALRDAYGADLVTLIVESQFSGGNGSLMESVSDATNANTRAFSAIAADSIAPYNYTLAHELGHNLGAGHERGNTADPARGPFTYSYGYRFTASDGVVYHDLMSYDPGTEIPYYANPAINYHSTPTGAPAGSADEADLALTFAQTAPLVTAYRPSVVPDVAPTATLDTVRVKDGFAYVTIRYQDDSGIDVSTIDSNDLTVFTPGFPQITPVLDSLETPVSGAFNRATYRFYLQDMPFDASAISVGVKANAVKDITGKVVPASQSLTRSAQWSAGFSFFASRDLGALKGSMTLGESLGELDSDDVFKFTLDSAKTVSARLTGLSADANLFIASDKNGDGVYEWNADPAVSEDLADSFRSGNADESLSINLPTGTYYAWVYGQVTTPYKLALAAYMDSSAPTAKLDATDILSPTNAFTFTVAFDDDHEINADFARSSSPIRLTNPFGGYYIAFPIAIDADVNGPHRVVTYQINAGLTLSAAENGTYTVSLEPNTPPIFNPPLARYVSDGAGNLPATGVPIGSFKVAIGQADVTPPTNVRTDAPEVHRGGATTYDFDVTMSDNVGLTSSSLMASQVNVIGPDGVTRVANAISVGAAPPAGSWRTVHYRLTSLPGGSWDLADYGTYNLSVVAGVVKDSAGNSLGAVSLGSFKVNIPLPGDANGDNVVNFTDLVLLAQNYNSTAKSFAQGNFDDDPAGNVNFSDLVILAQRYNTSRPALMTLIDPFPRASTKQRDTIALLA